MKLNKKLIIGVIAIAAIFVSNLQYAIDNYGLGNWGLDFDIIASGSGSTGTGPTGTGTDTPSGKDTHMSNCGSVERWDNHLKQWVMVQKYEGYCTTGTKPDCRYFNCTTDPDALTNSTDNYMESEPTQGPDIYAPPQEYPDLITVPFIVNDPKLNR